MIATHKEGPFRVTPHCPFCSEMVYVYRGVAYGTKEDAERARDRYINNRRRRR